MGKMASLIERVVRQALRTFSQRHKSCLFDENFEKLKALADQLTAGDVKLNIDNLHAAKRVRYESPVTYISVYEDAYITISIFIVKSGEKLPLHDHPHMYGILKVIAGTVKIQSYTAIPSNVGAESASSGGRLLRQTSPRNRTQHAIKMPEMIVSENDGACFLTPSERNLHEIQSVDGPAAFLDILSPPYDDAGERSCHYFKEASDDTCGLVSNQARLIHIPSPPEYWNDVAVYEGPTIRYSSSNDIFQTHE
jgi:cysteamine dioxygenase